MLPILYYEDGSGAQRPDIRMQKSGPYFSRAPHSRATHGTLNICFGSFIFRISEIKYPEVVPGSTVFAQGFLYNTEAKECHCTKTQELDPARRLSLRITGSGLSGPYTYFVTQVLESVISPYYDSLFAP